MLTGAFYLSPGYLRFTGAYTGFAIPPELKDKPPVFIFHSTDVKASDLFALALRHNYVPHLWVDIQLGQKFQGFPLDLAAKTSYRAPGTIETNEYG